MYTYFPRDRKISQMESFAGPEEMLITFSVFHSSVSRISSDGLRGNFFFSDHTQEIDPRPKKGRKSPIDDPLVFNFQKRKKKSFPYLSRWPIRRALKRKRKKEIKNHQVTSPSFFFWKIQDRKCLFCVEYGPTALMNLKRKKKNWL